MGCKVSASGELQGPSLPIFADIAVWEADKRSAPLAEQHYKSTVVITACPPCPIWLIWQPLQTTACSSR